MAPNILEPLSLFTGPFSATLWPRAARAKGPGQGKSLRLPQSLRCEFELEVEATKPEVLSAHEAMCERNWKQSC